MFSTTCRLKALLRYCLSSSFFLGLLLSRLKEERYYRNLLWIWWALLLLLLQFWRKWDWGWHKSTLWSHVSWEKLFFCLFFCLLWKMHSGKKSLCGNSGFIAFLKLGEMESFPSFRFLIERLTLKSSVFTKNVLGGPTSFELLFYHFWSFLSHYWILLDCVSRQFLGNFWATFRPFSVYF